MNITHTLNHSPHTDRDVQLKQIRAVAIKAACELFADRTIHGQSTVNAVLEQARTIENYIDTGTIPTDNED